MYQELDVEKFRSKPPSLLNAMTEIPRTLLEIGTLSVSFPLLASLPKGDGHPVLVLPGFMAGDESTMVLRRYLSLMGYEPMRWNLGRNTGKPEIMERSLLERFESLSGRFGQKISLIGQSLGGVFARELAHLYPDEVRQVITLGSPFSMEDASGTNPLVEKLFERSAGLSVEEMQKKLEVTSSPPVPTTAVYSKGDGVVNWRGCKEREIDERTQNIQVIGSHCGMAFNSAIYHIIADRLAQTENKWQKYNACSLQATICR